MEYIYSAMLLNSVGQKITEENVKKVLTSAGAKVNEVKVKALVSALEGVKIDEVIKQASIPVVSAPAPSKEEKVEGKKEEKPEETEKKTEEAASGLASLFG